VIIWHTHAGSDGSTHSVTVSLNLKFPGVKQSFAHATYNKEGFSVELKTSIRLVPGRLNFDALVPLAGEGLGPHTASSMIGSSRVEGVGALAQSKVHLRV
jgi:hypothetical protein